MENFPLLFTRRLRLVKIDHGYDEAFFNILSLDDVTKYYGRESLQSVEEAAELINSFQTIFKDKRGIRWGIMLKETDDFIGTIGIHNYVSHQKRAEVGFELHPNHWRKGILTEALDRVLEYCFQELGIYRIGAVTFPANTASNQLLEKSGFKQEGKLRGYLYQHQKSQDANVLSIIKPDWIRKRKQLEEPVQYTDHMTEIIKRSEASGDFSNLPGKGKPLSLGPSYVNSSEAQMYKTLKDNHVLPAWVELANEIDTMKEMLVELDGKERRKLVKEINKKIKAYNYACPPSLQKNKVSE
ncbi:GNAT family N-acetyltransferase [Ornithinibacillus xuwenensis]|uniref:GNAT family N-acetyltransferase n=1 Tax=Ornithinibacillus xuwenensis TaxID=3144668 RepID=A0ABU9XIQ8_9BACI